MVCESKHIVEHLHSSAVQRWKKSSRDRDYDVIGNLVAETSKEFSTQVEKLTKSDLI